MAPQQLLMCYPRTVVRRAQSFWVLLCLFRLASIRAAAEQCCGLDAAFLSAARLCWPDCDFLTLEPQLGRWSHFPGHSPGHGHLHPNFLNFFKLFFPSAAHTRCLCQAGMDNGRQRNPKAILVQATLMDPFFYKDDDTKPLGCCLDGCKQPVAENSV